MSEQIEGVAVYSKCCSTCGAWFWSLLDNEFIRCQTCDDFLSEDEEDDEEEA